MVRWAENEPEDRETEGVDKTQYGIGGTVKAVVESDEDANNGKCMEC